MVERDNVVSDEEIMKYLHNHLIKRGFAPELGELVALADIFFEYLVEKGVIEVK
jgi:hypothetical protein